MGNNSNACAPKAQKRYTERTFDSRLRGRHYDFREKYNVLKLIQEISQSAYEIVEVRLSENCDIGCALFAGSYSLEGFYAKYPTINKEDLETIQLTMSNDCLIFMYEHGKFLSLFSKGTNATIEDFISC